MDSIGCLTMKTAGLLLVDLCQSCRLFVGAGVNVAAAVGLLNRLGLPL